MQPNDHHLRLFLAVARARSLRTAAENLHVTQPALSKQIRALEALLPMPLFRRDGRGMELTSLGQELFRSLSHSFGLVDAALDAASRAIGGPVSVTIATVNTLGAYLLPDVVATVKDVAPGVLLSIVTASSPAVVERVERSQSDLGLVYDTAVDTDTFTVHPLFTETLCGYRAVNLSARRSLDADDLLAEPLILPPQPYALRRAVDGALKLQPKVAAECTSVSLALDLAKRRMGIAILPAFIPQTAVESRNLERVEIIGGRLSRQVVAIVRRQAKISQSVEHTLTAIRVCVGNLGRLSQN